MKSFASIILLLTAMTFACSCYGQTNSTDTLQNSIGENLLKNAWVTDHIFGLDPKIETYKLTRYRTRGKFAGNITQFLDSLTFKSEYTAWCGTDYFTQVFGKFKFLDNDKITITVETVSYSGVWKKPTEHRKTDYLTFGISVEGDSIILTKQE